MTRKRKLGIGMAVLILLVFVLLLAVNDQPASPAVALPNPNGYDDFVKAGLEVTVDRDGYPNGGEIESLRTFITNNAEPLRLLRLGLSRDCRVPIEYSQDYVGSHLPELALLKQLGHTVIREGKLAEMERRYGDAARAYLDAIRLGQEVKRGGVLIDGLVGVAIESLGSTALQALVPNLHVIECREAIQTLEIIESKRESFAEILKHEKEWSRRSFPWRMRVVGNIQRLFKFSSIAQAQQRALTKFQTYDHRQRTLMIDLATRAYELEKGQRPKSSAELVPGYLKAVPLDPLTGTNMVNMP